MKTLSPSPLAGAILSLLLAACFVPNSFGPGTALAATPVVLVAPGTAALRIVTSASPAQPVQKSAATLATYLSKMGQASFNVAPGSGETGIVVGTVSEFPGLEVAKLLDGTDPTRREEYVLRSHARGVYVIGATSLGVSHAVWHLLHELGYRQYFPGANWEVLPQSPSLKLQVDTVQKPDYLARRIWYGFGSWKPNMLDKAQWDEKNRMASGVNISSGHTYDNLIKNNKAAFDQHPEYLTGPKSNKLCISNPGLRKLVVDHALKYFEANPAADSISMEPSDGGGWGCGTGPCQDDKVFKSVSDRVVTLANEVAEAVNQKFPGKFVGIYAYYEHSPPPTIRVHPRVAVNVATAFIKGGFTFQQLMEGWRKQGVQVLGVRDYYSYFDGHRDRPGGPHASSLPHIKTKTPAYYQMGGRLMSAESTESWGPAGLGFYLAARLLWNTKEDPDAIVTDFMRRSFGPAEAPMRRFYQVIDKSGQPIFTRHLIGQMYRSLGEARSLTKDPAIMARLDDLTLWTRYSEMLWDWTYASKNRKADGETILRFTYRWYRNGMTHNYVLWRHAYDFDKTYPADTKFNVPEGKNPWKSTEPITAEEIAAYVEPGITNNPVNTFTPTTYSRNLIPASALQLTSPVTGDFGYTRMEQNYMVWVEDPAQPLLLTARGGQIAARDRTTLSLYKASQDLGGAVAEQEDDEVGGAPAGEAGAGPPQGVKEEAAPQEPTGPAAVATQDVPNDREFHNVSLKVAKKGLYRLRVVDRGKGVELNWPPGTPLVIESSRNVQTLLRGRKLVRYFYVPKGTKVVGGFAERGPQLVDGAGKPVAKLPMEPAYFSLPVPAGQDGQLWRIERAVKILLMTVPPYLARSADELLLPAEVVQADTPKN